MRILIDIAHPAHIHYFRNFASLINQKDFSVLFTVRDKGIIIELARHYKLKYEIRSKERRNKILYGFDSIRNIYRISRKFKPDFFIDMGTVFASPVSWLLRKPYIAFDDTEASIKARIIHMPFTNVIFTPKVFRKDLGRKHIRLY